nr:tyrosine-type recombinase/integrase [Maritimibacter sp. DP1N21-5]
MRYLVPVTPKGSDRTYWYFRRKGHKLIPMPDEPHDSAEFLAAYAEAKRTTGVRDRRADPGSLTGTIDAAMRSERFAGLSKVYRATMTRHMVELQNTVGTAAFRAIREPHIRANVTEATSPQDRLKAWRWLCSWAMDAGLRADDPSRDVTAPARARSDGHEPWTLDEIDAYRERWKIGTSKRTAFELLYWTGCRIGDGVRLGPGMVDREGVLSFRQNKTGGIAYVPWTCILPDYATTRMHTDREQLHAALAATSGAHMTFLATERGRTRSDKALGTMIREAAVASEITGKSAHGLRKARAVALADAGASTIQIGAWTGHESLKEIEHYTIAANRKRAVMGNVVERSADMRRR